METIGADAARLAGLQIDTLQKLRRGQITLEQLEWFNMLTKEERGCLSGASKFDPRFQLVNTFYLVVPYGYDHATRLASFANQHRKEFHHYHGAITDENFGRATTKLVSGRKLKVDVFQIRKRDIVTSKECMAFLRWQKAVLVGAQGASLAYELAKYQLPASQWSVSFDEGDALWKDVNECRRVPSVRRDSAGGFEFVLGNFEEGWCDVYCLLCFCEPAGPLRSEASEVSE